MNEQKKTNKRKILTRVLIVVACLLVVAAITVTSVFAANDWGRNDIHIDNNKPDISKPNDDKNNGNQNGADDKDDDKNNGNQDGADDKDDDKKPDDKPTSSDTDFASPVSSMEIVTGYEFGKDVTLGHWHFHTGLDMKADAGTAVMACLDGTVESVITGDKLDGTSVTISHANGLKTVYTFIEAKENLKEGDKVKRGEVIGSVAEANGSEYLVGPHLHFEVVKGEDKLDPTEYLGVDEK